MATYWEGCPSEKYGNPCDLSKPEQGICFECRTHLRGQPEHIEKVQPKTPEQIREEYFARLKAELK